MASRSGNEQVEFTTHGVLVNGSKISLPGHPLSHDCSLRPEPWAPAGVREDIVGLRHRDVPAPLAPVDREAVLDLQQIRLQSRGVGVP